MKKVFNLFAVFLSILLASTSYAGPVISIVAGFPAGTGHDLVARQLAYDLNQVGQYEFIVENRPGAGGQIAVVNVSTLPDSAAPKLLIFTNTLYVNSFVTKKFDANTVHLLKPVSFIGNVPLILNVSNNQNIHSIKDLKTHSTRLKAGTGGLGSIPEISSLYLASQLGLAIDNIPYSGQNGAFVDLSSGQLDIVIDYYKSSLPFIESGRVRPIAVTGNKRLDKLPNLATFKEQGLDWPLDAFFVLYASKNIDPVLLANLRKQIVHILQTNSKSYQQLGLTLHNSHNLDIEQFHRDMSIKYQMIKLPIKE